MQTTNGVHPQRMYGQAAGQGSRQLQAPLRVSNVTSPHMQGNLLTEQRLTSRMSQMQMNGQQPAAAFGLQQAHAPLPRPFSQSVMPGLQRAPGRGNCGTAVSQSAPMAPVSGPPRRAAENRSSRGRGATAPGRGRSQQPAKAGGPQKAAQAPRIGSAQAAASSLQRKRKSDDEGSSGDPPASRRKVAAGSQAPAVAGAAISEADAETPSSSDDWKAAAAQKLQRRRPAR